MPHHVSSTSLNIRSDPRVVSTNRLATLPQGHVVEKLEDGGPGWWKVSTTVNGAPIVGFVASQFLTADGGGGDAHVATTVGPVHLAENRADVTRTATSGRAFPLGEADRPRRRASSADERVRELHAIVAYLDVEHHARYRSTSGATYCNIYAYDYCYLAGVYLPRVWWTSSALSALAAGRQVPVRYDDTVRELNANALFDWLRDAGGDVGWRRTTDVGQLQMTANEGGVAIICAQRKDLNRSGHICAVVPERSPDVAKRSAGAGAVSLPLQSQAGSRNFCYSCGTARWWTGDQFRAFGFWVHA